MHTLIALDLKVARRKAGLTQSDCAHLLGVHPSKISSLETGKVSPTLIDATTLAIIYGLPTEQLVSTVVAEISRTLPERLKRMPASSKRWRGTFNRQHTLGDLSARLAAANAQHDGGAA